MAQAPRSSASSAGLSDDPLENASAWLQLNMKPILVAVAIVVVGSAAVYGYRVMDQNKQTEANAELYKATGPLTEGKLPEAQAALEKVVKKYGGTTSGAQASMLLAQVLYDQKKFAEGITSLEAAKGSAGSDFGASVEALEAIGYEAQGKFDQAAEHYAKAAAAARFPADKAANQANQARSLTSAGKLADARKVWEELAKLDNMAYSQEAQVRLGELAGAGK